MTLIPPIQTRSLAFYRRPLPDFDRWASGIPLPPSLAGRHLDGRFRDWLSGLARSVFQDLERGIEIQDSRLGRRIFLLRTFDLYIRADLLQIRSMSLRLNGKPRDIDGAIGSPFASDRWMPEWLLHRATCLASLHSCLEAHALAYPTGHATQGQWLAHAMGDTWTWASASLVRLLNRSLDIRLMRHVMRDALRLDPALLNLARRAQYVYGGRHDVTSDWYNLCVRHRDQLEYVNQTAPGLLPYLGHLMRADEIEPTQPPLGVLKRRILEAGGSQTDWRYLVVHRARPVWKRVRRESIGKGIEDLLCSWAIANRRLLPPPSRKALYPECETRGRDRTRVQMVPGRATSCLVRGRASGDLS